MQPPENGKVADRTEGEFGLIADTELLDLDTELAGEAHSEGQAVHRLDLYLHEEHMSVC